MFHYHRSENDIYFRASEEKFHLLRHFLRQQIVVCVEVLQPAAVRKFEQSVTRSVCATIGSAFKPNSIAEALDNFETAISRPVIQHDDFFRGPCLRERAFDCFPNPTLRVAARNQDRNKRCHSNLSRLESANSYRLFAVLWQATSQLASPAFFAKVHVAHGMEEASLNSSLIQRCQIAIDFNRKAGSFQPPL